jgi:hypothetical protein
MPEPPLLFRMPAPLTPVPTRSLSHTHACLYASLHMLLLVLLHARCHTGVFESVCRARVHPPASARTDKAALSRPHDRRFAGGSLGAAASHPPPRTAVAGIDTLMPETLHAPKPSFLASKP